jgi:filamentous hemagglutinin
VISVNTRTGELYLWDAKYRSAGVRLTESMTFRRTDSLNNALAQATQSVERSTLLSPNIRSQVLANLEAGIYNTRTVAYGAARNSVIRQAGPDQ